MEVYSPREIALAAGVDEDAVVAALGSPPSGYVPHDEAVRVGRLVATIARLQTAREPGDLFELTAGRKSERRPLAAFAVSASVHALFVVAFVAAGLTFAPRAAALQADLEPADPMRLVFLASPGPVGGGGGGGLRQKRPAPKAMREGRQRISSPLPIRREPKPIVPTPTPVERKPDPPLAAEQLPVLVAPVVTAPADARTRIGVLEKTTASADSHGPGQGRGAGTGTGTGIGAGDGSGIGPGSGGGTGGGPFRPGSGIQPPRLLREVRADYTEDARRRNIAGEVVLEIVVRRDGSVGDVRVLQGLPGGLNERAVQAVRQWKFAPAERHGSPVDVIVEVAVEFKLR